MQKKYTILYQDRIDDSLPHLQWTYYKHITVKEGDKLSYAIARTGIVPTHVIHGHLKEVKEKEY
jgi:hypothetical protein